MSKQNKNDYILYISLYILSHPHLITNHSLFFYLHFLMNVDNLNNINQKYLTKYYTKLVIIAHSK